MSDVPESFLHYLAAWNEMDTGKVRALLERSCDAEVLFIDPLHTTRGLDELETMIVEARAERPTAGYHRTSGVDGHNLRHRYLWEARVDGKMVIPGMDVTTVNEDGRILQIDGFFGEFPAMDG